MWNIGGIPMKGFSELKFAGPRVVSAVFLIMFLLMFLPFHVFESEVIQYTHKVYSDIYRKAVDQFITSISRGYFQWNDMFNAFISQDREFINSMFQEILTDFPYVREIRIVERPSGMTMEKDYMVSMKNEELYAYVNIMDSLSQNAVDDVVVMVGIDKHEVLEGLSMADRVILSDEGKKIFAYGLHASVRGYGLYNWLVFHAFISGLIGVLLMMEVLSVSFSRYHQTKGLQTIVHMWELQDPYTTYHSRNVAIIAEILGKRLGLKRKKLIEIVNGAKLHDIGKLGISTSILKKKGPLNEIEREVMMDHPRRGKDLLEQFKYLDKYIPYAYAHHEREDGSGYPQGLKGEEIPFEAKILAVADVFEALTADRPYREAYSLPEAAEMMTRMPLDQRIVPEVFKALPELYEKLNRSTLQNSRANFESSIDVLRKPR